MLVEESCLLGTYYFVYLNILQVMKWERFLHQASLRFSVFSLKRIKFYLSFDWDLSLVSELGAMSTNKERIENLEASFGDLQTKFDRMEVGVGDKLRQIEAAISRMSNILITRHETSLGSPNAQASQSSNGQDLLEGRRPMFTSKLAKLEFPRYSGDDPTKWFT